MNAIEDVLSVPIIISPSYLNEHVVIEPRSVMLNIRLEDGSHVITTEPMPIGHLLNFGAPTLMATFTLWYRYEAVHKIITLCSSELVSPDSSYLTTYPVGSNQTCKQHGYAQYAEQGQTNSHWNYRTPLFPQLEADMQNTVDAINQMIRLRALECGISVTMRTPMPKISAELYQSFCMVFYQGKFLEYYDKTKVYDKEYTFKNLDSTWYGQTTFAQYTIFANVIGSSNDPTLPGYPSWISLWKSVFVQCLSCTSQNVAGMPGQPTGAFTCSPGPMLYGGHVVLGQISTQMPVGSNLVLIMPICPRHNSNNGVYMETITQGGAITLRNYLNLSETVSL